jgi:dihydroflavonol-4-reductase
MKKVAVTGASGHIGANLVRELIGRGHQVVVLIRQTSLALEGLDVVRIQGDLLDQQSLCKAFRGVDHVYHLAAHISVQTGEREKLESINVAGTRNVIEACRSEAVSTLIYFSSIHALDMKPLDQVVTEENPLLVRKESGSDYEYTKARAESLVREHSNGALSTRIIYPTAVLGPNDFNLSLFGQAILRMAHGRLPALVPGGFNWVDARDVAWGAVEAVEKGADGDRYILSGNYLSVSQVAAVVAELTGKSAPRITIPTWLAGISAPLMGIWARLQGEPPVYTRYSLSALASNKQISHSRATTRFAYQPRSFHSSMEDTLQFYAMQNEK